MTIDREEAIVLVEDVLDATEAGVLRLPLPEIVAALEDAGDRDVSGE